MYQSTNFLTHTSASSVDLNGVSGYCGQYFNVLNIDSEYGLSLLTDGLLKDGVTPRFCKVASIIEPFIGPPLSACSVTSPARTFSVIYAADTTSAACSADCSSNTSKP